MCYNHIMNVGDIVKVFDMYNSNKQDKIGIVMSMSSTYYSRKYKVLLSEGNIEWREEGEITLINELQ